MAPALNEPLNQAQLPLSPASASQSPRPGILPSNGADLVQKPHATNTTNRYNASSTTTDNNSGTNNGKSQSHHSATAAKSSFQLAFIQQISNTATNGPAPTGPPNVQRHMDRKDPPSRAVAANATIKFSPHQNHQQQQQQQQYSASSVATVGGTSSVTAAAVAAAAALEQQFQLELAEAHDDEAALKSDVQELADLDLHLDEETANALINHHSLCDTPPLASGSHNHHQHHHQQQQNHHDHHQQLLESPSHNNNTMGLQKDYLKENTEMEQMLGELANTSDLDLLQVFKSLAPSGSDNLCELASGLALFNDVDVMNIGLDEVTTPVKEPDTADIRTEIKKRQTQMQRKCDFLLRRLRKLQTRSMADHVDEEVQGLFDHTQKLLKRKERSISTMQASGQSSGGEAPSAAEETAALLHRLDTAADEQQQQLPVAAPVTPQQQQRKVKEPVAGSSGGIGTVASACLPGTSAGGVVRVVPCFESAFSRQVALTAGHLHTELKIVGAALDSDATASSSGGDSGDEFSAYSKQQQQQPQQQQSHLSQSAYSANLSTSTCKDLPLVPSAKVWCFNGERMVRKYKTKKIKRQELLRAKRAAARWSRDRATIASRWSWLLAQVSDLEYRIRQHSELHQQIKKNKGAVTFEDGLSNAAPTAQLLAAISTPDATVNGYRGLLPGNNTTTVHKADGSGVESEAAGCSGASGSGTRASASSSSIGAFADVVGSPGACRTRAFQRNEFRKRKLLQTTNLHTISKKAAKQSTVKCGCQWPLYPCALCTGRPDPTAPRDLPDMLSSSERVGLLDAGFHPVISFGSDIGQGIHIESTLRNIEFQTKACRATSKSVMRSSLALQKAQKKEDRSNRKLFGNAAGATPAAAAGSPATGKKKYNTAANKLKKKTKKNSINANSGSPGAANTSTTSAPATPANQRSNNASNQGSATSAGKHKKNTADGSSPAAGGSGVSVSMMTASQQHQNENFEYGPNGAMLPRSKNTSPTHGQRSGGTFYASASRSRGAYDIDNIVIPYSVAATTRVEILQCKEIPTPKWRTLDDADDKDDAHSSQSTSTKLPTPAAEVIIAPPPNVVAISAPNNKPDDREDVSADAILRRHENALAEERKKFATYLKFPWSTRSRANRRIDSRADSSGANTPDPTSPALPKTPEANVSSGSVPTPQQHSTMAGVTALDPIAEQSSSADILKPETLAVFGGPSNGAGGRRRTVSTKRISGGDSRDDRHSGPIDPRDYVQPYEQREFPLSDEAFETMLQLMPTAHHDLIDKAIQQHQLQQQQQHHQQQQQHQNLHHQPLAHLPSSSAAAAMQSHHQAAAVAGPSSASNNSGSSATVGGSICKTEYDFENLIGAARVMGPISGVVGNPYGYALAGLRDTDEETESIESGMMDEDPNDPEWFEPSRL